MKVQNKVNLSDKKKQKNISKQSPKQNKVRVI